MAPLAHVLLLAASALTGVRAHFTLNYPTTIGFDEDKEDTGPCGSYTPDFSTDTVDDFYVGGDNVAVNLLHSQGNWLFRATLDTSVTTNDGDTWTQLFPIVQQSGLGKFCEPAIAVPESWAGQQGVVGVVVDAPDGLLYQCAAVNFVAGVTNVTQSACTNSSGVSISYVSDSSLTALVSSNDSSTSTANATASSTAASASSSELNAAPRLGGAVSAVAAALAGGVFLAL